MLPQVADSQFSLLARLRVCAPALCGKDEKFAMLEPRIVALEAKAHALCGDLGIPDDMDCLRIAARATRQGFSTLMPFKTGPDFYDHPLAERPLLLNTGGRAICGSERELCKTILFENSRAPLAARDPLYSRYYLIVVQYIHRFSSSKLHTFMRAATKDDPRYNHLTKNDFCWGFTEEAVATALTGAVHNAIGPIGLDQSRNIPVILDSSVPATLCGMFVGGLHPLVKIKVPVKDFIRVLHPLVADISEPLDSGSNADVEVL